MGFKTTLTGIEINQSMIKVARIEKIISKWRLVDCEKVDLPDDALQVYYRKTNIRNRLACLEAIKKALKPAWGNVLRIGLSIPNDIVKLSVQEFADLPSSETEIRKMIHWWAGKSLPFPVEDARIAHYLAKGKPGSAKKLLIGIAIRQVIRDYEMILKELGADPEVIQPSGINQFNFYSKRIPSTGINAYIGLLSDFFTYLVFEDDRLLFYRAVKRGFTDVHFWQEIDIIVQQYMEEFPEKDMEKLYIGSQVPLDDEQKQCIRDLASWETIFIDAGEMTALDSKLREKEGMPPTSFYDAAIGAAQSLA